LAVPVLFYIEVILPLLPMYQEQVPFKRIKNILLINQKKEQIAPFFVSGIVKYFSFFSHYQNLLSFLS
ncbi:MAG TPA: hypothetical protein VFD46_04080, partial [Chryseolinea sp.]|nr:hypothetical protein [Chryseolinea sp.]